MGFQVIIMKEWRLCRNNNISLLKQIGKYSNEQLSSSPPQGSYINLTKEKSYSWSSALYLNTHLHCTRPLKYNEEKRVSYVIKILVCRKKSANSTFGINFKQKNLTLSMLVHNPRILHVSPGKKWGANGCTFEYITTFTVRPWSGRFGMRHVVIVWHLNIPDKDGIWTVAIQNIGFIQWTREKVVKVHELG